MKTELVGTAHLTRFILRCDRIRMLVWVAAIASLVAVTASSVKALYPTQLDLDKAAAASEGNAAAIAFNGPAQGLDTVGGEVAFQAGAIGLVTVALMSLLITGRLTRGEEEAGRMELLRSLPVGAHAPTAAAAIAVTAMNGAVGALITLLLIGQGLPRTGAAVFGVSFALTGLVFAAATIVVAQITENTRVVYGISGALLGAAFLIRAIGDVGDGTVSWLSPIGWAQKTRPFAGEKWWPLLPSVAAVFGLLLLGVALAARRDLGGGLVAPRRGRRCGSPSLGNPLGLAVRLQRGSVIGWSVGVFCIGAAYGSIANDVDDFVGDNKALADMVARAGGASLTDSYLATSFGILALVSACFAVQSTLRLRSEETSLRAEPVLATPVARARWALSHITVALAGSVIVLAVAGLAVGVSYGLAGGGLGATPRLICAAVTYAPSVWLLVGLAAAGVGLVPRWVTMIWVAVALCFVIGLLGALLDLPPWLTTVSPFEHIPRLPVDHLAVLPLVALTILAAGLTGAGLAGLRQRDIG